MAKEEDRARLNVTVPPEIAQEVEDICVLVKDLKVSQLVELALRKFLKDIKVKGGAKLEAGLKALREARVEIDLS